MPRPPRCRRICGAPQVDTFCPNGCENTEPILLTLDEYEVIRLVDLEQKTHEQCAVLGGYLHYVVLAQRRLAHGQWEGVFVRQKAT